MGEMFPATRRAARVAGCLAFVVAFLPNAVSRAEDEERPVVSEPAAEAPSELTPIVVDADKQEEAPLVERSFETAEDATGFGETIFAEPAWRGFESTAEILGESVGAQLRRQGGRDDFATLTIRGAPSAQLRILLDGVPLGRASDNIVNLADLPLDSIERIDVYRGFAPVALSATSAAGLVNILTRDPSRPTARVAAGGGSFGSAKVNAGGAGPVAGGSAAAFASWRHSEGDYEYLDDNGTIFNPNDDRVRKRANNDSDAVESLLRWRRDIRDAARLQLRNYVFYKDEGVPGIARFAPPEARLETVRDIAVGSIGSPDSRWSAEQGVTWQSRKLSRFAAFDNTGETTASTTTVRWGAPLGKANWFSGSSDFVWEDFDQQSDSGLLADEAAERSSLAIGAGDDWTIDPIDTTLTMQLRYQQIWNERAGDRNSENSTDPRLGVKWQPLEGFAIKANVSSYFRPPVFDELYGTTGFTTGNPDLEPEEGISYDAGFEWTAEREPFGRLALAYSWFGNEIDDIIVIVLTADRVAKARNLSRARIRGHEARVEWRGPAGFAISANYTFQDARNLSSTPALHGKDLPGLPPHEAWARLSWTHGIFVLAYDVDVAGSHFIDTENVTPKLPTRTVHGVSVIIGPFWKDLRLTLEADNLGDSLVPDEIGFPLPGRAYYATLSWSYDRK